MRHLSLLAIVACTSTPQFQTPVPVSYEPPVLSILTPGYEHGPTVRVSGSAAHVTDVTLSGVPVTVNDGTYEVEVPLARGVNLLELAALDLRGDDAFFKQGVVSGTFDDPDDVLASAVALRLNQGGLDAALDAAAAQLTPEALALDLNSFNPVYSDSYGVFGIDAVVIQADLIGLTWDTPILGADPANGRLDVEAAMPDLLAQVHLTGSVVGISLDETILVTVPTIELSTEATVDLGPGNVLQVGVQDSQLSLNGFAVDTSFLPSAIETSFLVDRLRDILEQRVVETLESSVPPLLAERLETLELSFATEVLGREVAVTGQFSDLFIDATGIQLETDLQVDIERGIDVGDVGYLTHPRAVPSPDANADLSISVADDLLNNLLFQLWRGGLLTIDLDSAEGELDPIFLADLGARDAARVRTVARTAPVFVQRDGRSQLQVTELEVRIETPGGERGERLTLSVTAFIDIELVVENGVLKLDLGTPQVTFVVRENDWGVADNTLGNLLAQQIPIDTLLGLLGSIELPLPTVAGIGIADADAVRDPGGAHTSIGASL